MPKLYVGYDPRESAVFHVFCQSVMDHTSRPISITPLHQKQLGIDGQQDGTNAFIYSRYLVPYLEGYQGWAAFVDGDMVCRADLVELFDLCDASKAVMVVKHNYKTRHPRKYLGTPLESDNVDYPRKNWSSVILWNCGHPSNRILTKELVEEAGGAFLHRFQWLKDDEIGEIPDEWNHLVGEYDYNPEAKLVHYTLGVPGFTDYMRCQYNLDWNDTALRAFHLEGERPEEVMRRAQWRHNGGHYQLRDAANGNRKYASAG